MLLKNRIPPTEMVIYGNLMGLNMTKSYRNGDEAIMGCV
jgi:hypothetical protein